MTPYQAARLCINSRLSHKSDVHRIGTYLKATQYKGTVFRPDRYKELECYVNTDFCG